MTSGSACPLCKRSFGLLLWRHVCGTCKRNFCEACAPKCNGERRCKSCGSAGTLHKQQQSGAAIASGDDGRERCVRAAEERMKAAQQRGKPQRRDAPGAATPPNQREHQQQPEENSPKQTSISGAMQPETAPTQTAQAQTQPGTNPVLEAAMRRRQQEQLGMNANRGNSDEKVLLITEITKVLHQRGEEEPFGLRAMDEAKLRSYLRYIKGKNNNAVV
ncbi:hypothetical protein DQ04_03981030 [Trypanosoma grayi]|uniref:hypothetical protein n=1 Tax=Trypanosoma grayi TaxID=71804 RepID=UPI0004F46827|nr:hypothetical protein DQ04_03981030 [Trypanosoma grayi]KEG10250.1 hypothetical protein DQ04_03981030 [Trypanosoma grayi]